MPKLCVLMDRYDNPFAGTESQVLKLVQGLIARGWEIEFAVLRGTEFTRRGAFPVAVRELGIGSLSRPASWRSMYAYGRDLKRRGFDLVQIFFNDASILGPPALRVAGISTLIARRDMGFWYTPALRIALRCAGWFHSGAICNSRAVAELTGRVEGLGASKVHVVYNGYPPLEPLDRTASSDRNDQRVVGIVANLRPIKRIEDLIAAFAQVASTRSDVVLHVVGGGGAAQPYRELAQRLGVAEQVTLWGSQPDPERFVTAFDVAVLCSESEGFSNSIIEYLRSGKPVVCTRAGGNPEIVHEGVNGYLVDVGDVEALAGRIGYLLDHPQQRLEMGQRAREGVEEAFSIDRMLDEYERIYSRWARG